LEESKLQILPFVLVFGLLGATACSSDKVEKNTAADQAATSYSGSNADGSEASASPSLTTCYKGDVWTCAVEAAIVKETNLLREKAFIHSFEDSYAARVWSDSQAESGKISHDGFPDKRTETLRESFQASWGIFAENVAMAQTQESDPAKVGKLFVTMWNNSPGHRANMLGNYSYLGAGVARVGNSVYATQIFH
jgi:uncharacterized protein YkwD